MTKNKKLASGAPGPESLGDHEALRLRHGSRARRARCPSANPWRVRM